MKPASISLVIILALGWSWHSCHGQFKRSDSIAHVYQGFELTSLKTLSDSLTSQLSSPHEKFRAIFTWVCMNISADHRLYVRQKKARIRLNNDEYKKWQKEFSKELFTKLSEDRTTLCSGYTYLVKELAYHAGIRCEIIQGYARSGNTFGNLANHSWIAVKLDNKWYLCDPTWSAGKIDGRTLKFIRVYDDSFFLMDPKLFIKTHYPNDSTWRLIN